MRDEQAIEFAVAEMLRTCCELGAVELRPFWSLSETQVSGDHTRKFPCLSLDAATAFPDGTGITLTCPLPIRAATLTDKDRNHAALLALYTVVRDACDRLYYQTRTSTTGDERTALLARLAADVPLIAYRGCTIEGGGRPSENDGLNEVEFTLNIHYHKTGF